MCFIRKQSFIMYFLDDVEMRLVFSPAHPRLVLFSPELDVGEKYFLEIDTAYLYIPSECDRSSITSLKTFIM